MDATRCSKKAQHDWQIREKENTRNKEKGITKETQQSAYIQGDRPGNKELEIYSQGKTIMKKEKYQNKL